jgi:hypothetical protein
MTTLLCRSTPQSTPDHIDDRYERKIFNLKIIKQTNQTKSISRTADQIHHRRRKNTENI